MGVPFRSQGWVLAGSVSNRERSSGYSQAWRDSAETDRSVAQIFRAEFSEAQQLGTGKAATIRGNVLHEEPAGDSILAPSEDKVKPRRSEVGGAGRASAGRTPSPAPTSAVWRDQGVSAGAILDRNSCPPNYYWNSALRFLNRASRCSILPLAAERSCTESREAARLILAAHSMPLR